MVTCRNLLEVIEGRTGMRSTLVAGQLPVDKWHPSMAAPTQADSRARPAVPGRAPHRPQGRFDAQALARSSLSPIALAR